MNLEQRIQITGLIDLNRSKYAAETVERLAYTIHEAEREAIELGKVVVKLNPRRAPGSRSSNSPRSRRPGAGAKRRSSSRASRSPS
jgi:hypothetical protein